MLPHQLMKSANINLDATLAAMKQYDTSYLERHSTVMHLAGHFENGQRVYFTADKVRARALVPAATTLTAFYSLCQDDPFAKTLLHSEVPKLYTWNATAKDFWEKYKHYYGHSIHIGRI